MVPFRAPLDDILATLAMVAADLDGWHQETADSVLTHFTAFAEEVIAPLDEVGDRTGARLEAGRVRMPPGFAGAYRQLAEGGWQGLSVPEQFGGMDAHPLLAASVSEIFTGANHAMQMVTGLVPGAVRTLLRYGTDAQQAAWLPRLAAGDVLATMCLTEPEAGSDLGRIRTRAEKVGDGWRLDGTKIFISGGDQDMSDGILHLVLARTGDAPGVKGLSLFLCPSDPQGVRNAVKVLRLEEKLGIHASPTCQLEFDGANADLIGEEGGGLAAMFTMMNHARIDVALQGVAHASRAHQIAAAHADTRVQGRGTDGAPARLADHADIARMLDEQRALGLGGRAMCHVALAEMEQGAPQGLLDVLTSVCKVFCSEAGIGAADLGIQILGGYGYLREYRIEQTWRDARITAIYEGANGIHARSLATRGLASKETRDAFADLMARVGGDSLSGARTTWLDLAQRITALDQPEAEAHRLMQATSGLFYSAVWTRLAGLNPEYGALAERVSARA